jgi:glycosyltransferase involved in cell wall biosynthesis
MRKTIAHLTSVHPRHDTRIWYKMCKSAAESGYRVTLVVADGKGSEVADGITVRDVGKPHGRVDRIWRATDRVFRAAASLKADLYHLHDPELMPAGLKLMRLGKRVIFDAHEDLPRQLLGKPYLNKPTLRIVSSLVTRYESYACHRFHGVIAATPFIGGKFLRINANTVYVCNFPLMAELNKGEKRLKKQREVCYVGGLSRVRGIRELVIAMKMCEEDVRLNLCGRFESASYEKEVKKLPGWRCVRELGHVGREDVQNIMGQSAAGIVALHPLVNYLDALPVKMFEYMSASIPVIASDFPLWREIVTGNSCGLLVNPLKPVEIANAINLVTSNPQHAGEMGRNGRKAVEEKYNWPNEEQKLLSFYERVLSN